MSDYIISFRNGNKIQIKVKDGVKFISDICEGYKLKPESINQFYVEPGILICVSDISACYPVCMEVEPQERKRAVAMARNFIMRADQLEKAEAVNPSSPYCFRNPKESGALRRASMDLTRALAEMRRA